MHNTTYALSVRQPYASLIAVGTKTLEWRSRPWRHRGPLIICASKQPRIETEMVGNYLPTGAAICIVDMVDCRPFTLADLVAACIIGPDDDPQKYIRQCGPVTGFGFVLANAREIAPVSIRGRLAPWIWAGPDLIEAPGWHESIGF